MIWNVRHFIHLSENYKSFINFLYKIDILYIGNKKIAFLIMKEFNDLIEIRIMRAVWQFNCV